jgi:hypothetical protein
LAKLLLTKEINTTMGKIKGAYCFLPLVLILGPSSQLFSQNVGIGTNTPHVSAGVEISSTNKGLLIPRMITSNIGLISTPAKGLMIYDTTLNQLMINMGTATSPDWQTVVFKSGWSLGGNNGINPSTQFIGTTDNQPLRFRINNSNAGELNPVTGNIFWGKGAGQNSTNGYSNIGIGPDVLKSNTSGRNMVAIGDSALFTNTTGVSNTAVGSKSLYLNSTGSQNTAAGFRSLYNNSTGSYNTANGVYALYSNTSGNHNTATGLEALLSNTAGSYNVANGNFALSSNTTGDDNLANGFGSLQNNLTGDYNTATGSGALRSNTTAYANSAVGYNALYSNTSGNYNTAVGTYALYANSTATNNTAVGAFALSNNDESFNTALGYYALSGTNSSQYNTGIGYRAGSLHNNGYNNVFVGANTDVPGPGFYNVIAVGQGTIVNAANAARFGNSATLSYGGWAGWTNVSDGRYKKNIQENVPGLTFIMKLRPVTYNLAAASLDEFLHKNNKIEMSEAGKNMYAKALMEKEKITYTGFVAQEVEAAAKKLGFDFSGVDAPKNENDTYGLRYAEFVVPVVKAMQEQQQTITDMQKRIALLEDQNKILLELLNKKN